MDQTISHRWSKRLIINALPVGLLNLDRHLSRVAVGSRTRSFLKNQTHLDVSRLDSTFRPRFYPRWTARIRSLI
jgi:hypothetical protein